MLIFVFTFVLAQLVKTEFTVNGLLGNSVTLVCNVNGVSLDLGTEEITWKHNSGSLFIDGTIVKQPEKFKLEINSLKYSDSGVYSCYMKTILLNSTRLNIEGMFLYFISISSFFNLISLFVIQRSCSCVEY